MLMRRDVRTAGTDFSPRLSLKRPSIARTICRPRHLRYRAVTRVWCSTRQRWRHTPPPSLRPCVAAVTVRLTASRPENERQCAYVMYRDTFYSSKARVRDRKVIRSIVLKHWAQSVITPEEQHPTKIIFVLKALLEDRVFELWKQARKEFLDLFAKLPPFSHPTHD